MNKKFLFGASAFAIAGSFLACGDGAINEMSPDDLVAESQYTSPDQIESIKNEAYQKCLDDVNFCAPQYKDFIEGKEPASSSSQELVSSSSSEKGPIVPAFSSAGGGDIIISKPSSSSISIVEGVSSSAGPAATGLGSCGPVTKVIEKGSTTKWAFKNNPESISGYPIMSFAGATYEWSFAGATPATGSGMTSEAVAYAASGKQTATVKVNMPDGASETITCEPLQVNGAPITDCVCEPSAPTADVAAGGTATWTVSGCKTTATITGYTWAGVTGAAETATHTFTKKGETLAPTVTVANDDNTAQEFKCGEVKSVDASSPDYLLEFEGDKIPQDKIEVKNEGCITINGSWSNEYYKPIIQVSCDASGSNVSLTISYGSETPVTAEGQYGVNNVQMPLFQLNIGANSAKGICIELSGAEVAKCGLATK